MIKKHVITMSLLPVVMKAFYHKKKGSETNGAVRKPVPPKLKVAMSTPCIPVQNQSRKRNKEVCTDESDEEDFNVFPSKS